MRSNIENTKKELRRDDLIKLAKDEADIRFDVENEIIEILQDQYNKEKNEGQSFLEWLDTKDEDYIRRIPLGLKEGGTVISITDYLKQREKPKIKKLNLDSVAPGKAISQLTDAERDVVKNLLRMTFENLNK
ncbi:hypothetical protein [Candidatus Pelagibacter sp. HIMB1495]|uniref:hypothetical protein n=1 Tax=unclassified Candidatus Pelagibacter TaxID=2647897 RepID=UPI003F847CA1